MQQHEENGYSHCKLYSSGVTGLQRDALLGFRPYTRLCWDSDLTCCFTYIFFFRDFVENLFYSNNKKLSLSRHVGMKVVTIAEQNK